MTLHSDEIYAVFANNSGITENVDFQGFRTLCIRHLRKYQSSINQSIRFYFRQGQHYCIVFFKILIHCRLSIQWRSHGGIGVPTRSRKSVFEMAEIRWEFFLRVNVPPCANEDQVQSAQLPMTEPNLNKKDQSSAKHTRRNTRNDCHQWLPDSSRVHQIRFRPGRAAPDPAGGAYDALPDLLVGWGGGKPPPHSPLGLGRKEPLYTQCIRGPVHYYIVYAWPYNGESKRSFTSIKMLVFGLRLIRTVIPLLPETFSESKIHQNAFAAGALLQTPLWELTKLPYTL